MKIQDNIKKLIPYNIAVYLRGILQKINGIYFKGNKYYCPYCHHNFRSMLPGGFDLPVIKEKNIVGSGLRDNNVCPRCYSTDRDRLIYTFLKEKTDIFSKKTTLLHVAPESSLKFILKNKPNIEYYCGDKYEKGYDNYYYSRDVIQIDITNIQYDDNIFDVIICNHVLEHVSDDKKALKELFRVLKPGGWAILQVPISLSSSKTIEQPTSSPKEREKLFGQFDHVRLYGTDYKDILSKAGFEVKIHNPQRDNWGIDIKKLAINPKEDIYVAYKPID